MRIRMSVQLSGPTMALERGDEKDFPQDEAIRLIKAGFAVPVTEMEVEKAIITSPQETRFASVLKMPEASARERGGKRNRR